MTSPTLSPPEALRDPRGKRCPCGPDGPFCGACAYDDDGELVAAQVHGPCRFHQ